MQDIIRTDRAVVAAGRRGSPPPSARHSLACPSPYSKRRRFTGGTANRGMGPLGIESRLTRERLFQPTRDEGVRGLHGPMPIGGSMRRWSGPFSQIRDTIHWLERLGVRFVEPATYFSGSFPHLASGAAGQWTARPGGAATMMRRFLDRTGDGARREALFEHAGRRSHHPGWPGGGFLFCPRQRSARAAWKARRVVIATGGFGNNADT